mmetsp:Transcript_20883/g.45293  ORF Transcript_20883/g.45293 Transcript_20883/m.45293 type:complete len:509 (+) Transcript_20883:138-1664(+)
MTVEEANESQNGRLVDLLVSLCADDNACTENEFTTTAGQVIDLSSHPQGDNVESLALEKSVTLEKLHWDDNAMMINSSLLFLAGGIVVLGVRRAGSTKVHRAHSTSSNVNSRNEQASKLAPKLAKKDEGSQNCQDSSSDDPPEPILVEENDLPSKVPQSTSTIKCDQGDYPQGLSSLSSDNSSISCLLENTPSTQRSVTASASLVSTPSAELTLFSDDNLKRQGAAIARKMACMVAGFQSAMKENGLEVSHSDSLSMVNQQFLAMINLQAQRECQNRGFLHDRHQRNIDRHISQRKHAENLQQQREDKDWFQKLLQARQKCAQSIFPAMQIGCVVAFAGYAGLRANQFYGNYGIMASESLVLDDENSMSMSMSNFLTTTWWWYAPSLVVSFARACAIPLMGVLGVIFGSFVVSRNVVEFFKLGATVGALVWICSIPWRALLGGQLVFYLVSQACTFFLFGRGTGQLSHGCPTTQEVTRFVAALDRISFSFPIVACGMNIAILCYCKSW